MGVKVFLEPERAVNLDDVESFATVVVVPLNVTFTYFLAVFSFGFSGDLAARQSMYPARMFTLPVPTAALAGWPMLYGAAAVAMLWLATRLLAVWPSDFDVPMVWPGLLAAVLLAWTQALTWMPYGLPGLRVIVTVLWLAAIDAVVLLAIHYHAHEGVMVAGLAPQLPLAFLVARNGVARARGGDVPDWHDAFARLGKLGDLLPRRRHNFSSPASAQAWFEWRRHGRGLPALVGILLPFELALLFLPNLSPAHVFLTLFGVMVTPPFMAAFAAATVRKSTPHVSDAYGVSPLVATRPMTSAALIAAKLESTIRSTLVAWLLLLVAIPLVLVWSGTAPVVIDQARHLTQSIGTPRAITIILLIFAAFMASTWKQLVQTLFIGLSGREWVVRSSVFLALAFLATIGPILEWIIESVKVRAAIWASLPWILAVLVCFKMSAAAWIATRLYRSRVLSDRTLVAGAACWVVAVLALHGVLAWIVPAMLIPRYILLLFAILELPLARLSAAPLALAWNRHG